MSSMSGVLGMQRTMAPLSTASTGANSTAQLLGIAVSDMPFSEFYARVINLHHGANVENRLGSRPRGAFTDGQPGAIRLLAVLLNPGQPHFLEAELQGEATGIELARIMWKSSGSFLKNERHSPTLVTLRKDVSQLFGRPFADCCADFMFTNLVRCTTKGDKEPDAEASEIGAGLLCEEIALWKPDRVIAYGRRVASCMTAHGIRFDAELPHPAAQGKWLTQGVREARVAEVRKVLGFE